MGRNNKKYHNKLPETGENNSSYLLISGILLSIYSMFLVIKRRLKRQG
ncbi:TPA: LPXTG cell wall anchor domain-containing protein [Enterococcus faecalis]